MSGIRERRFWQRGMLPSEKSIESAEKAIRVASLDREEVGALIHASVCRDHLEPATASRVHYELQLPPSCMIYDVSNACLGLLNGIIQVANMIELGHIRAGIVVGTEGSRQLVETTIGMLNDDQSLSRSDIKSAVASLTIGSGSCAVVLTDGGLTRTGNQLLAAAVRAETAHHSLCQSGRDEAAGTGMQPLMHTNSEALMQNGIAAGVATFPRLLAAAGLTREELSKTFCHQVGAAHRKAMLAALEIPRKADFSTLEWLGNTGSVALPMTMAIGLEAGHVAPLEHVGMLGIGSGINCVMLAVHWRLSLVGSSLEDPAERSALARYPR
jgi:3-oxoacyl-[acyl-carrier-protein] synthase-3